VKAGFDRVSPTQRTMHQALELAGVPVAVVRNPTPDWKPTADEPFAIRANAHRARCDELRAEIVHLERRRAALQERLADEILQEGARA
jgi:hypothetical protein